MTTSRAPHATTSARPDDDGPREAYVWVWLHGATSPVVAGLLELDGDIVTFTHGRSYLARDNAIALYEPERPLERGRIEPFAGLRGRRFSRVRGVKGQLEAVRSS